ncbi:MAG: hypothetical protein ACPGED_04275, partial [Flavobacteriales bacterium]
MISIVFLSFVASFSALAQDPGDVCSTAFPMVEGMSQLGDNSSSVIDDVVSPCVGSTAEDVWFSFDAVVGGNVLVTIDANGTLTDPTIAIYEECGQNAMYCTGDLFNNELNLYFPTNCASTYYIQVSGVDPTSVGTFDIVYTEDASPNSGCADPMACNFSGNACAVDDGSCAYVPGCTYDLACNYDAFATCDDNSCVYPDGCTDPTACNYNEYSICDDGSCSFAASSPANDSCGNAITMMEGVAVTVDVNNTCDDAVNTSCFGQQEDVWYSFTSITGGEITFTGSYTSDAEGFSLAFFDTCDGQELYCEGEYFGTSSGDIIFNPECGSTYLLLASSLYGGGSYDLVYTEAAIGPSACTDATACNFDSDPCMTTDNSLCVYPTLTNDACSGAIALTDGVSVVADNTDSCLEGPNSSCSYYFSNPDVWYSLTPNSGGAINLTLTLDGSMNSVIATVYEGCGGVEVACDYEFGSGNVMEVDFETTCGLTYYVQLTGYANYERGTFSVVYYEDEASTCQDVTACNYAACANVLGVCVYPDGCIDPLSCDYDINAVCDDGSCTYDNGLDLSDIDFVLQDASCGAFEPLGEFFQEAFNFHPSGYLYVNGESSDTQWASCGNGLVLVFDNEIGFEVSYSNGNLYFESILNPGECLLGVPLIAGCNFELACNYDPAANYNDGSCVYTVSNDQCSNAFNLPVGQTITSHNEGTCLDEYVSPCLGTTGNDVWFEVNSVTGGEITIVLTANGTLADPNVTILDACGGELIGCSGNLNFNNEIIIGLPGICGSSYLIQVNGGFLGDTGTFDISYSEFETPSFGCADPIACNYSGNICAVDDGSCGYVEGCTYGIACNFDPLATCDDGSCDYPDGCTDPLACNYDQFATCDDGSCSDATLTPANDACANAASLLEG